MKFVVRMVRPSRVFPCQNPSSSTQCICTKTDPPARLQADQPAWSGRHLEPPVIHWNPEGRENDTEHFGSVEAEEGPAVVWILHGRFWVGHDSDRIPSAADNLPVSVFLCVSTMIVGIIHDSRDCCFTHAPTIVPL